jgi:transcriptional regulator with XRE-family HTH domain
MNSVGAILRTERERQGRETAEIAGELCVTQRYLRAIEKDDLKSLPGSFFYKSFVKQYAAILGIDEKSLQAGVDALVAVEEAPAIAAPDPRYAPDSSNWPNSRDAEPQLNLSSEVPDMGLQGRVGVFDRFRLGALKRDLFGKRAADAEVSGFSSGAFEENGRSPVRTLDPIIRDANRRYVPQGRIGLSVAALVAVLLVCSGFYAWWNRTPQHSADRAVSGASGPAGIIPVKASTASAGAANTPAINVTTTTGPDGVNRVVVNLSATEKTWLSITCDGKRIFSGVLEPSQTKTLFGSDVATMKVGNAGGIEVLWNGKSIGPIGPRGQVREVLFTPDNFEIKQPTKPL